MNFHPSESLPAGGSPVGEAQLNLQADAYGTQMFNPSDSLNLTSVAGSPMTGAEAALAQPALMPGAEAALAQPSLMPGADALAGVIAGANEPISPIIQLILRMPGAMGLINSFFEFFSNFFMNPASLFNIFDPTFLGHQAASIFSFTTNHIPLLSQGITNLNGPLMGNDLLSSRLNLALGQGNSLSTGASTGILPRGPLTVSGTTNLSKPLFDGSTGTTGALSADGQSGVLAGPGLTDAGTGGHLAASNRLFSDQIGGSSFRSVPGASAQSQPVAGLTGGNTPSIQASGNGYSNLASGYNGDFSANHVGSEQASFRSVDSADLHSAKSEFGPSGCVGDQLGAGNNQELLALEQPSRSFTPTVGADSGSAGGEMVGLRAKQLSLDSVKADPRPGIADQSQSLPKAAAPKAPTNSHSANHSATHKAPAPTHKPAHPHHKVEHKVEHKAAEKTQAPETASEVPETDGSMIAEAQAPGATVTYTVQKGDCLWNIAREHMGEGMKWQDLYKLNQDILGANPDLIYPGTTIQIPGQGAEIASSGSVDYVVQPGDNLWNISRDHLGQGHMWGDIYHLNQDVIGANPSLIHPGQHLNLPGSNDPGSMALSNQVNTPDPSMTAAPTAEPAVNTNIDSTAGSAGQPAPAAAGEPTATNYYGQDASLQPLESSALPDANQTTFTPTVGAGAGTGSVSQAALPVIPANSLPVAAGPGAAQAATLNTGKPAVVDTGILGDLKSFINDGKR